MEKRIELSTQESKKVQESASGLPKRLDEQEKKLNAISQDLSVFNPNVLEVDRRLAELAQQTKCNDSRWSTFWDDIRKQDSKISEQKADFQALEELVKRVIQGIHKANMAITEGSTTPQTDGR